MGKELTPRYSLRNMVERKRIAASIIEPILTGKRDRTIANFYERVSTGERVHTVLSPVGTSTFRLSSSESLLFKTSTNLQNQPKRVSRMDELYQVRDVVVADEGYVLVAGDYKGAEAVLVAAYMRDWSYLDDLLSGVDTHRKHAVHFYGIDWDAVTALQRDTAKNVTYASFYGALAAMVARTINRDADFTGLYVSQAEVEALRLKLLALHPLQEWWQTLRDELTKTDGVLRNCLGFRRVFRVSDEDERVKAAASSLPQSTVACLMNEAIIKAHHLYKQTTDVKLLHQIHDELLFHARPDSVPSLIHSMTSVLQRPFTIHGRELYIPVEWKVGPDWGHMKLAT